MAISHYVFRGNRAGFEPTPLFSRLWLVENGFAFRNLADYLRRAESLGNPSPHPLFDPLLVCLQKSTPRGRYGVLEDFLSEADLHTPLPIDQSARKDSELTYGRLLAVMDPVAGEIGGSCFRLCFVVDDVSSLARARQSIDSIVGSEISGELEIILIPSNSRNDLDHLLRHLSLVNANVSICRRSPATSRGQALNEAVRLAKGENLVFLHSGHRLTTNSSESLLAALEEPDFKVAQPLVLDRTGLISSAGVAFVGRDAVPSPWLRGVSPETADMPERFIVPAAQFPFIVRRQDLPDGPVFNETPGANWIDVDMSLRMAQNAAGAIVLVANAPVIRTMKSPYEPLPTEPTLSPKFRQAWPGLIPSARWPLASTTLQMAEMANARDDVGVLTAQFTKPSEPALTASGFPRLRWSIKTSAPSTLDIQDPYQWGDTYFAQSLRESLVRLGQIVTVDYLENRAKVTSYLDDVVLNLQGYEGIAAVDNAVNITWVISHPELVERNDLLHSQLNYAASHYWADLKSHAWNIDIRPLLQCTDQHLFHPPVPSLEPSSDVVFVGNAVNREREIVESAVALGIEVAVYGKGWQGRVPSRMIRAEHIGNEELCAIYAAARATLNDHWPDMRKQGFLSNRAFDVVASGGRLISDEVHGVPEEVLASMEIEYGLDKLLESRPQVAQLRADQPMGGRAPADYVLAEHTFDARAQRILRDVLHHLNSSTAENAV